MSGRAANGTYQTQARALRLSDDRRPPAGSREIEAVPQTATVIPLQIGRALPADHQDLAEQDLAEVSPTVLYTHREQEVDLLDWTISNLFYVGLILLPAARQHSETAQETAEALRCLDDTICRIRDHVRNAHPNGSSVPTQVVGGLAYKAASAAASPAAPKITSPAIQS